MLVVEKFNESLVAGLCWSWSSRRGRGLWSHSLGVDRFLVDVLPVLKFEYNCRFHSVSLRIKRDGSCYSGETFGLGDSIAQLWTLGCTCFFKTLSQHLHGVVTERGKGVRFL